MTKEATMDKLHLMRMSVMARAYREQEDAPGVEEMTFDERFALGVAACNNFYSVRYVRLPEMLDDLCTEKSEEWLKRKKRYIKCDLLIIDDWLLENAKANEAREILEVIEGRSRTSSTMLCSQFGAGAWHAKLGKGAVADAVIDRLSGSKAIVVCML